MQLLAWVVAELGFSVRTIADRDDNTGVSRDDSSEAIGYRVLDRPQG